MRRELVGLGIVGVLACNLDSGDRHSESGSSERVALYFADLKTSVNAHSLGASALAFRQPGFLALNDGFRDDVAACQPGGPGAAGGFCLTPKNLRGWAETISLNGIRPNANNSASGGPEPSRCGPGRLLSVNTTSDTGMGRTGGVFDLRMPEPVGGNAALQCEEYTQTVWNSVAVHFAFLDAQIVAPTAILNARFVFEANPLTEEPVFREPMCTLREEHIKKYEYLTEGIQVQRGDVQVCVKDSLEETCTDEEYQWVDLESKQLSSTRPSKAYQLDYIRKFGTGVDERGVPREVYCSTQCDHSAKNCGFAGGGYDVEFGFASDEQFKLHSEIITDKDPRHPQFNAGVPPVFWYTHTDPSGAVHEGAGQDMKVVLRLDTHNFLYLNGVASADDMASLSLAELASRLTLTDMFSRGEPHNFGHQSVLRGRVEVAFDGESPTK